MNTVMPLMSAVFCFTFPVGLGIYWIASAVVRSAQQWFINRHLDKMDINDLVNENMKKMEKQRTKEGLPPQKITNQANQSTKNINTKIDKGSSNTNAEELSLIHICLVDQITSVSGYTDLIQNFITDNKMTRVQLALDNGKATSNSVIDFLYALSPSQWKDLASMDQFKGFADTINTTSAEISKMQNFCGLNIADQPLNYIKAAFEGASIALAIAALLIPILAWATQVLNYKLMPQATSSAEGAVDTMQASMKTMNTVMPLMSAVFCFTFPVGLGIYWIASAVEMCIRDSFRSFGTNCCSYRSFSAPVRAPIRCFRSIAFIT